MRTLRFIGMILALLIGVSWVGAQPATVTTLPDPATVTLTPIADEFIRPLGITHAGDGSGRLFVLEQGGRIWIVDEATGERRDQPFLDLTELVSPAANDMATYTERGLLGAAFHPDYAENGFVYINYTDRSGTTLIVRYTVSADDPDRLDPASAQILLAQMQPFPNHNGGWIAFSPNDGYLYISLGDGGAAGDPLNAGQALNTWLGKILRLDVDDATANQPYRIPDDNPFVAPNDGALPEIWAYGLRNAWRNSFDRATGDLYIADVGQNQHEEVNFQPAASTGGENYGWRAYEATHVFDPALVSDGMVMPFAEYPHSEGVSVTGGYVYRGAALPALTGVYFYGDFGTGTIWAAVRDDAGAWQVEPFLTRTGHAISAFGENEAGELFLVDYRGAIYRFDPAQ